MHSMEIAMRFFVFALLLIPALANATDILLTWDLPTVREDGSAIEQIDNFKLYTSIDNDVKPVIEINGASTSHLIEDVVPGNYTFNISTVEDAQEGALSDPVSLQINEKIISRIGKIKVTIEAVE